jgi:hypothetical protein
VENLTMSLSDASATFGAATVCSDRIAAVLGDGCGC